MTRINFGIPVVSLTDQHLLAEIRELPRIPRAVKKKILADKKVNTIGGPFRLGTGHVTWFNDKLAYLHDRYINLYAECIKRKFSVQYDRDLFTLAEHGSAMHDKLLKYYNSTKADDKAIALIKSRIMERIFNSKQVVRYYGKALNKNEYLIEKLKA